MKHNTKVAIGLLLVGTLIYYLFKNFELETTLGIGIILIMILGYWAVKADAD